MIWKIKFTHEDHQQLKLLWEMAEREVWTQVENRFEILFL